MRFVLVFALILAGCTQPGPNTDEAANPFTDLTNEYFQAMFENSPTAATAAGLHTYDSKLDDLSAKSVANRIVKLKAFQSRLAAIKTQTADDAVDAEFLASRITAELFDLETLQTWKKNPMHYIELAGSAVDGLMKREFAPSKERLQLVTARLKQLPSAYEAMQANVSNPPKEFTDLAIRMAKGTVDFLQKDVPAWAAEAAAGDAVALAEFKKADDSALEALKAASTWLSGDLKLTSKGNYAIGTEAFAKKLLYEEMVDIPLNKLLAIGEANLEKDYRKFLDVAGRIESKKSPAQVMASLSEEHPSAERLIPATKQSLAGIRKFLVDRKILNLPNEQMPIVRETPPFARNGSFASMDSPGVLESKANEAFYYVTPPEKDWDAKHVEEHLRLFNKPVMDVITIHEVFPGHFTQFLFSKQYPTKVRQLLFVSSNAEGWAHYAEQMMIEEGYGLNDPKLALAQLSEALLRDCRYIAGIKLHTEGWTVEQATRLFMEKGFQERANAFEEARRGTYNPTYLYYTLGKLQIYKLREDYRQAKGIEYSLINFHDAFIKAGPMPLKLVRKILLPMDKNPTL